MDDHGVSYPNNSLLSHRKPLSQPTPIVIKDGDSGTTVQAIPKSNSKPVISSDDRDIDMENSREALQLSFGSPSPTDDHDLSKPNATDSRRRQSAEKLVTRDKGPTRQHAKSFEFKDSDMDVQKTPGLKIQGNSSMSIRDDRRSHKVSTFGGVKQECFTKDLESGNKQPEEMRNTADPLVGKLTVKQFQDLLEKSFGKTAETREQRVWGEGRQQLHDDFQQLADSIPPVKEVTSLRSSNTRLKNNVESYKTTIQDQTEACRQQNELLKEALLEKDAAQLDAQKFASQLSSTQKKSTKSFQDYEARLGDLQEQLREEKALHGARITCQEEDRKRYTRNIEQYKAQIEAYKSESEDSANQLRETRKEFSKFERELLGAGSNKHKVSDDDLRSSWLQLHWRIRDLATSLAEHIPTDGFIEAQKTRKRLRLISRKPWGPEDLLQDPEMGPLLLQAYLWRVAEQFLYPDDNEEAALTDDFENVRIKFLGVAKPGEAPAMAAWFAQGWKSIEARLNASRASHITAFTEAALLTAFIPNGPKKERDDDWLGNELRIILREARELNAAMGASKAVFERDWLNATGEIALRRDKATMEKENYRDSTSKVMFTISPLVVKHGNADGHRHDSQLVLMKAKVALVPNMLNKESDEGGDGDIDMDTSEESDVELETDSDSEMQLENHGEVEMETHGEIEMGNLVKAEMDNHGMFEEELLSMLSST